MSRALMGDIGSWPRKASRDESRRDWLRAEGVDGLPTDREDVSAEQSARLEALVGRMQAEGLYSKSTKLSDAKWGVRVLVGQIRRANG